MSHGEVKRGDDRRLLKRSTVSPFCKIEGCGRKTKAMGLCSGHYKRLKRHGAADGGGTIRGEPERYLREVVIPHRGKECLFWPYSRNKGYGQINIGNKPRKVHQIVCAAVHGPRLYRKLEAAHSCGNGHLGCVNPDHLSWKTHAGNMQDMVDHGRSKRGRRQGASL